MSETEVKQEIVPVYESGAVRTNPCRACSPLGASLAMKGVQGGFALLHGGQGCATYIRRYVISHFREPVDIGSSSFDESAVIFGGRRNLHHSLKNILERYRPQVIGIATTCLSETIGEDVETMLSGFNLPGVILVPVSTPSYVGSHVQGYFRTVDALLEKIAVSPPPRRPDLALIPGFVSPEDLRILKRLCGAFVRDLVVFPDYSETLDGGPWREYHPIPTGGTSLEDIRCFYGARGIVELGGPALLAAGEDAGEDAQEAVASNEDAETCEESRTKEAAGAGEALRARGAADSGPGRRGVGILNRKTALLLPIGIRRTDHLVSVLEDLTGRVLPDDLEAERGRLLDAYADGHKYVFGLRCCVYGDDALVAAMASFLDETGAVPVVCASGEAGSCLKKHLDRSVPGWQEKGWTVLEDADFNQVEDAARQRDVQLFLGNSKGYQAARSLGRPLLRLGFPVHDRFGAQRIGILGYSGGLRLYDELVNTVLAERQGKSGRGYTYM